MLSSSVGMILLFFVGSIGVTHIVVDGKIMAGVRSWFTQPFWPAWLSWLRFVWGFVPFKNCQTKTANFLTEYPIHFMHEMMTCYQCAGFWVGVVLSLGALKLNWWQVLAAGGASSFLSNMAAILMNYVEANTIIHIDDKDFNDKV